MTRVLQLQLGGGALAGVAGEALESSCRSRGELASYLSPYPSERGGERGVGFVVAGTRNECRRTHARGSRICGRGQGAENFLYGTDYTRKRIQQVSR